MSLVEKIKQVFVRAREGWAIDVYTRVEKDVLKILSSYTIIEKQKLQELADLLKTLEATLTTFTQSESFEKVDKKFVEVFKA